MEMLDATYRRFRVLASSFADGFRGVVTIMAFTDTGWMRQFRLSKRLVVLICLLVTVMALSSTLTVLKLVRGEYHVTRMRYLEYQNRTMTSLLEGQAEQLSRLKLEMARLKEFEESLRQVSGLSDRPGLQQKEAEPAAEDSARTRRRP